MKVGFPKKHGHRKLATGPLAICFRDDCYVNCVVRLRSS